MMSWRLFARVVVFAIVCLLVANGVADIIVRFPDGAP